MPQFCRPGSDPLLSLIPGTATGASAASILGAWQGTRVGRSESAEVKIGSGSPAFAADKGADVVAASGIPVAVVGATGVVGREMVRVLVERRFPVSRLGLFATARSAGKRMAAGRGGVANAGGPGA